jgi:hypothetical protein
MNKEKIHRRCKESHLGVARLWIWLVTRCIYIPKLVIYIYIYIYIYIILLFHI